MGTPPKQEKKFLRRWHDRRTMPPPKRVVTAPALLHDEHVFDPEGHTIQRDTATLPRRSLRNTRMRDVMPVFPDDANSHVSERLLGVRHPSYARHSSEWETETLFDQSNGDADTDAVLYPCPFRIRNPARFNIRDHETCARATFDAVRLK